MKLHASEVASNAAKVLKTKGIHSGITSIDNVTYQWNYDGKKICVEYELKGEVEVMCIE
nr:hypothetical protein [Lysinibacillus timonensis]